MKKWEDIVRDRMEELEGTLPESAFAEFRARRSGAAPAQKRSPLAWAMAPAAAAVLAAALLLRKPTLPGDGVQIIQMPSSPVAEAVVADTTELADPVPDKPIIARASTPKAVTTPVVSAQVPETVEIAEPEEAPEEEPAAGNSIEEAEDPVQAGDAAPSPFVPQEVKPQPVTKMKIAPVVGAVAGGGLLAALVVPRLSAPKNYSGDMALSNTPGEHTYSSMSDVLAGTPKHGFPLKVGLSTRIPVSGRLGVTTGLEYSLYSSRFTYSLYGEKKQLAHYVGIPVRLDWSLASNRWLDVYVGGGIEGDFCVAANLAGNSIKKDGFSLSLMGAGGIQFNVTKRLGIYVEPELIWTVPSGSCVLVTYRTEHPLMFSVASGLRINIGK